MKIKYIECQQCGNSITVFPENKTLECYSCGTRFERGKNEAV